MNKEENPPGCLLSQTDQAGEIVALAKVDAIDRRS